jgi:hypothetical protein
MAVVLAVQTVFGCCWHHAHFHLQCQRTLAQAEAPAKCCRHHHANERSENRPCQDRDKCQGASSYVVPQKVRLDAQESVAVIDIPPIVFSPSNHPGALSFSWEIAGSAHSIEPPLRLHLLHQTLLI